MPLTTIFKTGILIVVFFFASSENGKSQKFFFDFETGTGKSYLFESINKNVDVRYGLPFSLATAIKYVPSKSQWGIKLQLIDLESTISGQNWQNGSSLDGYIKNTTIALLLEKEKETSKGTIGFNFGMGVSNEIIQPLQIDPTSKQKNTYMSILLGGILSRKLSNKFSLLVLPSFLWQDPFKSLTVFGGRKANLADEDLSIIINFGIRYEFN